MTSPARSARLCCHARLQWSPKERAGAGLDFAADLSQPDVIVVDDGSIDSAANVARPQRLGDPQFHVISFIHADDLRHAIKIANG